MTENFQKECRNWVVECMGEKVASDKVERTHRFLEEALETVQAGGCSKDQAHAIVNYVYNRPVGELQQEVGGALVTLATLCATNGINMIQCGETELNRAKENAKKIRAKHANKPKFKLI